MTTDVGTTTTYFVGTHYEVTGSEITKYYYAGSQRIAMRKNGALNYIVGDHLGSTSLVTDASGNVINQTQYKAWGETRYTSGSEVTKYQYTGQYSYAADFGLHFYNARWYDSSLGRFAQADTIVPGGVQGYDRYAYANNNPVKYIDPTGHCFLNGHYMPDNSDACGWGYSNSSNLVGTANSNFIPPPVQTQVTPQTLGGIPGFGLAGDAALPGPLWSEQMTAWPLESNPLGLSSYSASYPGTGNSDGIDGKLGHAVKINAANPNPSLPTALICMSGGSESCLNYFLERLKQRQKTTHIVLIGATWTGSGRTGFDEWKPVINNALVDGTKILIVDDGSYAQYTAPDVYSVTGADGTYEKYSVYYPYENGTQLLCHHTSNSACGGLIPLVGSNNSQDLVSSVYTWIATGHFPWPYSSP